MNTYAGWFFFTVPSPFQHSGSKATFHLFLWNVLSAFCRSLWQISKCTPLFQHLLLRYIIIIKNLFVKQKNEPEVPIHFTFALSLFTGEVFFPLPFNQSHNSIMFRLRALAFHTNSRYKTLARKFFTLLLLSRFPGSWINASPPFSYNFIQWVSPASLRIYSDRLAQALHLIPFSPILCGQYRCTQQLYGIILDL